MANQGPWTSWRQLTNSEVQSSDDSTYIVSLPRSNILHTLALRCEITNGSTSAQDLDLSDVIDLVEVIANGSDILLSLNAIELEKWGLLTTGHTLPSTLNEGASAVQQTTYVLPFGRRVFDPNYWLPAAKTSDLELRVRYSPPIGVTAFTTGTTTFSVLALITAGGEPGTYRGTLKTTNIASWTTAASGDQIVDLPRGNPYRRILVSCYEAGIADGVDITNVRMDVDNQSRTYLNMAWDNLQALNQSLLGLYPRLDTRLFRSDTDTVDTRIGNLVSALLTPLVDVNITNDTFILDRIDTIGGDQLVINSSQGDITAAAEDLIAYATDHAMQLSVVGWGIPYGVLVDFDHAPDGMFLNSGDWSQAQVVLTQGGAGGTARVSLQEVLKFA